MTLVALQALVQLHKEVPSRMASTSVKARPRKSRDARLRVGSAPCAQAVGEPRRVDTPIRRRIASNFAFLSAAELVCRTTSVIVTLSLAKRLGVAGYGRIEFAFNVVFWLVLLLRDSSDVIVARELSRHPRLIRPLVDQVLAYKSLLAIVLFSLLACIGSWTLTDRSDLRTLLLYGSMLFTTAVGLDYVFRGTERMGLVALSLCIRTGIYALGVLSCVRDASRIAWVPLLLAGGEVAGIALVWRHYLKNYRLPRPRISLRFLSIMVQRGRTVCLIQLSQAVIISADLLVVGFLSTWGDVGLYGAPHRMVTALLTFGLILQQAAFPALSRLWREKAGAGREALDSLVEVLMTGLVPVAVGCTVLADPLVHLVLPSAYAGAGTLLALGIWRAPLLILAYLYQTTLIALNRESVGVRTPGLRRDWNRTAGGTLAADHGAARGVAGRDPDRSGPGAHGLWLPGPGRTTARLASSSGASRAGVADDDSGVPCAQAFSCFIRRAGWGHHVRGLLGGFGRPGSHAALETGPGSDGTFQLEFVIAIGKDATGVHRDMEVAHENRHDHDVLWGTQLRR